jgi:apolipoprotein N-acyltransferase
MENHNKHIKSHSSYGSKQSILLAIISLVCIVSSYLLSGFPFLIMLAIAPLLKIYEQFKEDEKSVGAYSFYIILPLALSFTLISFYRGTTTLFQGSVFGILMALSLIFFWLTDTFSKNRLGYFTIIIFWLALEYAAIKLNPELANLLLGSCLIEYPVMIRWNSETGMMGVSAWILLSNILLYYALFKGKGLLQGNFRPLSLFYALLAISIPGLISWFLIDPQHILTVKDVILAYSDPSELPVTLKNYAVTGEVFGRTAAWISVLLILYSLVKRKVSY